MMSDTKNSDSNVFQLNHRATQHSLETLNRATGLEWASHPESLLPNGLVINGTEETVTLSNCNRRRA